MEETVFDVVITDVEDELRSIYTIVKGFEELFFSFVSLVDLLTDQTEAAFTLLVVDQGFIKILFAKFRPEFRCKI